MVTALRKELRALAEPDRARFLQGYFKTAEPFLGVRVPVLRKLARQYRSLSLTDVTALLRSRVHEERLLALMILVGAFAKAEPLRISLTCRSCSSGVRPSPIFMTP